MASIVLHSPGGIMSGRAKDVRILNHTHSNLVTTLRAPASSFALQDRCVVGFAKGSFWQMRKQSKVRSVGEEALTETEGGVFDVEDEATLEKYFKEAGNKLVILDISTRTCGPCKMIYPKLVKMSKEYPDVVFLKINGDHNKETRALMRKWGVRAVPNFRFFRNGQLIHSHTGAKEDELRGHFLVHYAETVQV